MPKTRVLLVLSTVLLALVPVFGRADDGVADPGFCYVDVNNDRLFSPTDNDIPVDLQALLPPDGGFNTQVSKGDYIAPRKRASLVIPESQHLIMSESVNIAVGWDLVIHGRLDAPKIVLSAHNILDADAVQILANAAGITMSGRKGVSAAGATLVAPTDLAISSQSGPIAMPGASVNCGGGMKIESGGELVANGLAAILGSAALLQSKGEMAASDAAINTSGPVTLCAKKTITAVAMAVCASDARVLAGYGSEDQDWFEWMSASASPVEVLSQEQTPVDIVAPGSAIQATGNCEYRAPKGSILLVDGVACSLGTLLIKAKTDIFVDNGGFDAFGALLFQCRGDLSMDMAGVFGLDKVSFIAAGSIYATEVGVYGMDVEFRANSGGAYSSLSALGVGSGGGAVAGMMGADGDDGTLTVDGSSIWAETGNLVLAGRGGVSAAPGTGPYGTSASLYAAGTLEIRSAAGPLNCPMADSTATAIVVYVRDEVTASWALWSGLDSISLKSKATIEVNDGSFLSGGTSSLWAKGKIIWAIGTVFSPEPVFGPTGVEVIR
ncbi:MAG: hypothetical protein FJX72_08180 [Armatimonadetes bacterium]|nr:hypothetical protein [Armatimonadota bacterium]